MTYKYQIKGYDKAGGAEIEKFRKWTLKLTQKQMAEKIGIAKNTYIAHIKGYTAWKKKETNELINLGANPDWFKPNIF